MNAPRALRAVPGQPPGGDPLDRAALEEAYRAEVARARRGLPGRDGALFDCYLGRVVRELAPTTEADPINVLASLICATGAILGEGPHLRAGDDKHPLLVWPLIIGRTGNGKKGTGWGTAKRLLHAAAPEFITTNVRSGLSSGEGLAEMLATRDSDEVAGEKDDAGEQLAPRAGDAVAPRRRKEAGRLPPGDHRLLIVEAEWAGVMSRMRREGNSLSAMLRAAWEGGELSTLNVNARIAPISHVAVLAHITPDEFRAKIDDADLAGGTYNRFLPLAVAQANFLPLSQGARPEIIRDLGADLAERLRTATDIGLIGLTGEATTQWCQLYLEFGTYRDDSGPVEHFLSRTAPNCLRIAAVHAALDGHTAIDTQHLTAAAALVRYSNATVRAIFATTLTRLAAWIAEAGPDGRTRDEIRSDFFGRNKRADQITPLLDQLITAGHITRTTRPRSDGRPGRGTEVFRSAHPPERG